MPTCRLCGGVTVTVASGVRDHEYGAPGVYRWQACRSCAVVALDPVPSAEVLRLAYPPTYHAFLPPSSGLTTLLQRVSRRTLARRIAKLVPAGGAILDVGCAHGQLLSAIGSVGDFRLFGIEYDAAAAAAARAQGIVVWQGDVLEAPIPPGSMHAVVMQHVLEHVADPLQTLTRLRDAISPGGHLIGELPNIDSWDAALFGKYWGGGHAPRHLWHFSPDSLRSTLRRAGLTVRSIQPALHTGHWALSFQNLARRNRSDTLGLVNGRSWYYPPLLLLTIPINLAQILRLKTGVMRFHAQRI